MQHRAWDRLGQHLRHEPRGVVAEEASLAVGAPSGAGGKGAEGYKLAVPEPRGMGKAGAEGIVR